MAMRRGPKDPLTESGGGGFGEGDTPELGGGGQPPVGAMNVDLTGTGVGGQIPFPNLPGEGNNGPLGRGAETPRERGNPQDLGGDGPGGAQAALRRPSAPTPMAGSQFTPQGASNGPGGGSTEGPGMTGSTGGPSGLVPFQPMAGPSPITSATPQLRSLYGKMGGLTGGGLGVPYSSSPAANDPIDGLIQMLMSKLGGGQGGSQGGGL